MKITQVITAAKLTATTLNTQTRKAFPKEVANIALITKRTAIRPKIKPRIMPAIGIKEKMATIAPAATEVQRAARIAFPKVASPILASLAPIHIKRPDNTRAITNKPITASAPEVARSTFPHFGYTPALEYLYWLNSSDDA